MTSVRVFLPVILTLTLTVAAGGIGEAAKRLPIVLDVRIDRAVVAGDWSEDETRVIENDLRVFVQQHFSDRFPHWFFPLDSQTRKRRLEFRVAPWQGDSAVLRIVPWIDEHAGEPAAELLWLKPGERSTQGFPPPETAAQTLGEFIENIFLRSENNSAKIGRWLRKNVPIGAEGAWMDSTSRDSLMIALPLPMEEFGGLQKSLFKISGRQPGGGTEELEAVGVELPTPYPPDNETPDMLGLGVLAQIYIVGTVRNEIGATLVDRVRRLRLGPVYLVEERPPTPFDSADWVDE